jgi:hypothetical protein
MIETESRMLLTIHPTESFARNHLEVNALIAIFRINQVRELYSIELQDAQGHSQDKDQQHTFSGTTPLKSTNAVVILKPA